MISIQKPAAACLLAIAVFFISPSTSEAAKFRSSQCKSADWYKIGVKDGQRGYSSKRIKYYQRACRRTDFKPDTKTFEKGRIAGLRAFCTPQNSARAGLAGRGLPSGCPSSRAGQVRQAYLLGREVFRLKQEQRITARRIQTLRLRGMTLKRGKKGTKRRRQFRQQRSSLTLALNQYHHRYRQLGQAIRIAELRLNSYLRRTP